MTLGDYDYDSDSSMPEEFKNTNHLDPIIHEQDSFVTPESQTGFQSDFKENLRNRAQKSNKSRERATQSYVQKKLKQIEQEEREKQKQEQRRRRNGEPEEEQKDGPKEDAEANETRGDNSNNKAESGSGDKSDSEEEDVQVSSRDTRGQHRSKGRHGHRHQQKAGRSESRGTSRSKSRPVSDSEGIHIDGRKDKLGYDIIDRSNKRANRHRRPEDEILEPIVTAAASIEIEDEEEEVEEEERIRFKHNLAFKTGDEGMAARPLTSRESRRSLSSD